MSARVGVALCGWGNVLCAWSTVSCMVSSFRFGGGMGSRPRRTHSRLGGAAVVTGSGEVAPKLHGLFGPRRITPLSTDKTMPLTSSIFETLVHFLQLGAKRPNCGLGTVGMSQISPRRRPAAIPPEILAPASDLAGAASCRMQAPAP